MSKKSMSAKIAQPEKESASAKIARLEEEIAEMNHLFELQRTRMAKATKRWREATGRHDVLPDLGNLLDWLMEQADAKPKQRRNIGG